MSPIRWENDWPWKLAGTAFYAALAVALLVVLTGATVWLTDGRYVEAAFVLLAVPLVLSAVFWRPRVTCPTCEGEGEHEINRANRFGGREDVPVRCGECMGAGKVPWSERE